MWHMLRRFRLVVGFLLVSQVSFPSEPVVRIGIGRNLSSLTVSSAEPFAVDGNLVRSARFFPAITLPESEDAVARGALETRMVIDLGEDRLLVRPMDVRIRLEPGEAPLAFDGRRWRGSLEVIGTDEGRFTLVNELPVEEYLLGVVPNELGPEAFPELEAIKAQAIAARTYVIRNLGQYEQDGFDICATDQCQVYFGLDTEHEVSTRAVVETRGMIATYDGEPINALYSSTCGGRTEDAANVFGEAVPYLVSTECQYEHPEPFPFSTTTTYDSWESGLLAIAGVGDFADAARFMGVPDAGVPSGEDLESVSQYLKDTFFRRIPAVSPTLFLEELGILVPGGDNSDEAVILRLLLWKQAFEWRDARIVSRDGETLRVRIDGGVRDLRLDPAAPIFMRLGETRIPVSDGEWVGGELMQVRLGVASEEEPEAPPTVSALVYEPLDGVMSADRYSPVAHWEVRLTRDQLDDAVRSLGVGDLRDILVLDRGLSGRIIEAEIHGSARTVTLTGPRIRTLFGLRDSLVYIEDARNARGELIGMTFFGGGWGHGVGMCQVGAFGMATEGAAAEEILKKYYRGIEIERAY
jgi:peptidoglycan hydrolase-like amidase